MAEYITPEEAGNLSGYNTEYIRALIRNGKITAVKKGYAWWVDRNSFLKYLKSAKRKGQKWGPRRNAPNKRD